MSHSQLPKWASRWISANWRSTRWRRACVSASVSCGESFWVPPATSLIGPPSRQHLASPNATSGGAGVARSAAAPSFGSALTCVRDLADQLLQHVFEEHHAGHRALTVHDTGQVGAGELHGCQYVFDLIIGLHGRQTPHPFEWHRLAVLGVMGIQDVLEVQVAGNLAGGIGDRKT